MPIFGGAAEQIGIALAIGGFGVYVGTVLVRLLWIIRWRKLLAPTVVIGFYARAVGTVGLMTLITGGVIEGSVPWPWLIAVFVFGAPALALLLVRPVGTDHPPFGVDDRKNP